MPTDSARLRTLPTTTRILIRGDARRLPFADLTLSVRLGRSLVRHALLRLGKLHGRTVSDLLALRGFGRTQAWELLNVLKKENRLDPRVAFPPAPILRPRGARPRQTPSWTFRIRIRPTARSIPFERCALSNWLRGTLDFHRMPFVGDLDGITFGALRQLRRFGRVQARELYHLLSSNDLLEAALRFSQGDPRDVRLAALSLLPPDAVRHALTKDAPPFPVLRHLVLGVAPGERKTKLAGLPLPDGLKEKLHVQGYVRAGDLHGVVLADLRRGRAPLTRGEMAVLRGMLRAMGALAPVRSSLEVPARWRKVSVAEVPMPNPLYNALLSRGMRTLGDLTRLTPERLGRGFGPVREASLRALVKRLRSAASPVGGTRWNPVPR
jgi:hypothetical protein